ncbi:MAG: amino acid adenylation domain-containing protein [Bacteroidota bacterium]
MQDKKSLLSTWLAKKKNEKDVKGNKKEPLIEQAPLAYNQEALYFLQQLHPDNPFYNYLDVYRYRGSFDIGRWKSAFTSVWEKHNSLRTRFAEMDGAIYQEIVKKRNYQYLEYDLQHQAGAEDEARRVILEEAKKSFDLSKDPLVRITMVQIASDQVMVGITIHHIIIDKWSMAHLRSEVARAYLEIAEVQASLPSGDYLTYAKGQRAKPLNPGSIEYWTEALRNSDTVLKLPHDYDRPGLQSYRGATILRRLPDTLSKAISSYAQTQEASPFTVLLSVFYLFLYQLTRQTSINVGVPFSNKTSSELENTLGFFDETVVITGDIGDVDYRTFLQQVKQKVFEAFEHRAVPLDRLVKELNPDRSLGVNPLFQTMFIYHEVPAAPDYGSGLECGFETLDLGVSKFDLTLFCGKDDHGFLTIFEYSTDLFKEPSVQRMIEQYGQLLETIITQPTEPVLDLNMMSEADQSLLKAVNATGWELPNGDILDLIEQQIASKPNAIAISNGTDTITYKEFGQRASSLAKQIQSQLPQSDKPIGLLIGRSPEMIIAIIACLKHGCPYIPLDPEYPTERIKFMVSDSQCELLITDLDSDLSDFHVDVISSNGPESFDPHDYLQNPHDKESTAYIIYTSGSTGSPKGVAVSRENLLNSTLARARYYASQPESFLLFSSFSFDSSVAGIYWTLISGGHLVIGDNKIEQDIARVAQVIDDNGITHTLLVPALYRQILELAPTEKLDVLECVIVAGEEATAAVGELHFEKLPGTALYNEYGPTEGTVWATVYQYQPGDKDPIPIGKPVANTQVHILDHRLKPVLPGAEGELVISGASISKGYLSQDMSSFVELPGIQGMAYRTGDMAKLTPEGDLLFLGRTDNQMKVRGHRLERAEIESTLASFEKVQRVALVLSQSSSGQAAKLVAYFTSEEKVDPAQITLWVKQRLPEYAVPQHIIQYQELPLLPNGKIDYHRLEKQPIPITSKGGVATSMVEATLLEIWREVLKVPDIGVEDNFFELGGDSILSIRIIARAKQKGLIVAPDQLFRHQTIRVLAPHVMEVLNKPDNPSYFGQLALSPIQQWFFETHKGDISHWNQGVRLQLSAPLSIEGVEQFAGRLLRHDGFRQTFTKTESGWIANYKNFTTNELIRRGTFGDDVGLKMLQDHMTLDDGPPIVIGVSEQENVEDIVIIAHHLVVDIVSWGTILDELADESKGSGTASSKNSPPSFARWVQHLQGVVEKQDFEHQLDFWRDQVANNLPGMIDLPLKARESDMKTMQVVVEPSVSEMMTSSKFLTTEEILLAAYQGALAVTTSSTDLMIALERHGRPSLDGAGSSETAAGWFTSFFPLRISSDKDEMSLLNTVKDKLRSLPDQGIGYGLLRYLAGYKALEADFPYTFNYLGATLEMQREGFSTVEFLFEGMRSGDVSCPHAIELNAWMDEDRLHCHFRFNTQLYSSDQMQAFTRSFEENTKKLALAAVGDRAGYSAADFPDAQLSDEDFDNLLDQL